MGGFVGKRMRTVLVLQITEPHEGLIECFFVIRHEQFC